MFGPGELELEQKLQIKHGRSVAVVNAPPESGLRLLTAGGRNPDQADVVIGFAVRPADLAWLRPVYAAARDGRLAWVSYPKPGQPGTDHIAEIFQVGHQMRVLLDLAQNRLSGRVDGGLARRRAA